MKEYKYYNLMEEKAPSCKDGKPHDWESIIKPGNFHSGWHEDECKKCGIRVGYDTSD